MKGINRTIFTAARLKCLVLLALVASATGCASAAGSNYTYEPQSSRYTVPVNRQAELEQLLAPIALYPDTLLTHILIASTYPLEIVQAERWLANNPTLIGQDAVNAAQSNGWDPSVVALVAFPQILQQMSLDLVWTQDLGNAFLDNQASVLNSVQNLRELAQEAGSLDRMNEVVVSREAESIIIESRERERVYVPYYDTRSVYGSWRWRSHQPWFWDYPFARQHGFGPSWRYGNDSFFWSPHVAVSFGFYSNAFHWGNRNLVYIPSRFYQPRYYFGHRDVLAHRYAQPWKPNRTRHQANLAGRDDRSANRAGVIGSQGFDRTSVPVRTQRDVNSGVTRVFRDTLRGGTRRVGDRGVQNQPQRQSQRQQIVAHRTAVTSTVPQTTVRPAVQSRSQAIPQQQGTPRPVAQATQRQMTSRPAAASSTQKPRQPSIQRTYSDSKAPRRQPRQGLGPRPYSA